MLYCKLWAGDGGAEVSAFGSAVTRDRARKEVKAWAQQGPKPRDRAHVAFEVRKGEISRPLPEARPPAKRQDPREYRATPEGARQTPDPVEITPELGSRERPIPENVWEAYPRGWRSITHGVYFTGGGTLRVRDVGHTSGARRA